MARTMAQTQTQHAILLRFMAVLPVIIFLLQCIGRVNVIATVIAGLLVCLKAWMEANAVVKTSGAERCEPPAAVIEPCALCTMSYDRRQLLLLTVGNAPLHICLDCYYLSPVSQCSSEK